MKGIRKARVVPVLLGCWGLCFVSFPSTGAEPEFGAENISQATDNGEADTEDYGERVRQMQDWLRHRRMEREHGWGNEAVSPLPPSADGEDEEEGDEEDETDSGSDYFTSRGLDERGFRRLEGNLRVRIRGLQGESAHIVSIGRQGRHKSGRQNSSHTKADTDPSRRTHRASRHGKTGPLIELKAGKSAGQENTLSRGPWAKNPGSNGSNNHTIPTAPKQPATKPQASKKTGTKTKRR